MSGWAPKEDTVYAFTNGDCWHLARELHRLTGYPMLFSSRYRNEDPDFYQWDHVGVVFQDVYVIDVHGVTLGLEWMNEWGTNSQIQTSDPDEIAQLLTDDYGKPLRRSFPQHNSRSLARRLTNHFNIPNKGRRQRDALPV